jgi:hypothetical protein
MTDVGAIFAIDHERSPAARSLPWAETQDGITVVVEPKPHWASDVRAFPGRGARILRLCRLGREHGAREILRAHRYQRR